MQPQGANRATLQQEAACSALFQAIPDLNGEARARIDLVIASGTELDKYGQVVPQMNKAIGNKIASDLLDVRQRVTEELHQGKHVLYVPGSYDLVHVGHASYILEGIETYLKAHSELRREDLYVVALADDDELIRGVKPPHLVAATGEHPRPIECAELFEHLTKKHPRLVDLATLPVDLVGFLPAPTCFGEVLNHPLFQRWSERAAIPIECKHDLEATVVKYGELLSNLTEERFADVKAHFHRAKYNLDYNPATAKWDVASWQLLLHRFIGDVYAASPQPNYVRMISEHDVKYKHIVAEVMELCGIDHHFVDDTVVVSTTELMSKFGWETLVRSKLDRFVELRT